MRGPAVRRAGPEWLQALAFLGAYVLLAGACDLLFRFGESEIAIFWVPSALSLAVFLRSSTRRWPSFALALFTGSVIELAWLGYGPLVNLGWSASVTAEPLLGATLLRRLVDFRPSLPRASDVISFVIFGALLAPMLSGLPGATIAVLLLDRPWSEAWWSWWSSAGMGVVLVAPLFLKLGTRLWPRWTLRRSIEMAMLVVATAAFAWLWSRTPFGSTLVLLLPTVITVPLLLWGALRFGVTGSAVVSVVAASTSAWNAAQGYGPFLHESPAVQVLVTQSFLAVMSVGGLALASTIDQWRRAEAGQRLLAEIGAILAADHDERAALRRVAERLVPDLADGCAIAVSDEDGPPAVACRSGHDERVRAALEALTHDVDRPLRLRHLDPPLLEALRAAGAPRDAVETLAPSSLLLLLLRTDTSVLGRLLLVDWAPFRSFDAAAEALADEVARRCTMALESARLRREQAMAIRSRDDFLSIASHELKTPLTPLMLQLARMARRVEAGADVKHEWIEKAQSSATRLAALIDDLLDAGKIASGRLALHREPMLLEPMLREVTGTFAGASARHRIALRLPSRPVPICADRFRLEQVLANLLDNAIKYSPLGGAIEVSLEVRGDRADMTVTDHGIGIPADQVAKLFERFFRARNSPSQFFGGLGLGLFICQDIVERHDGRIWVESQPGEGSTFHVELPLYRGAAAAESPLQPEVEGDRPPAELL